MSTRVERYDVGYRHFTDQVAETIRRETFGEDIGQNSWLTADEYNRFVDWLQLKPEHHVLDVASGSGGPALHLTGHVGCRVTGVDVNEFGVANANQSAAKSNLTARVTFQVVDAAAVLPFDGDTFDGLTCIDAMNHLPNRLDVFQDWRRVLRPGGRGVFTDPVVITGSVTSEELATRSSLGLFLFVPPGVNEQLIERAGLRLIRTEDVTDNAVLISALRAVRERYRDAVIELEGEERFEALQKFYEVAHRLTSERRLARIAYLVEKP